MVMDSSDSEMDIDNSDMVMDDSNVDIDQEDCTSSLEISGLSEILLSIDKVYPFKR